MPVRKIWKWTIAALVFAGAAIVYFLYDPSRYDFYLFCPLHRFTGLKCPLCGLQQMMHHLLHGQVRAAFSDNPFLFLLVPYFVFYLYLNVFRQKEKHFNLYKALYGDKTLLILVGVGAIFAVVRNYSSF